MPHGVLDVVAEDPEEEHVAADVEPTAVEEHRGQERKEVVPGRDLARDGAPAVDEIHQFWFGKRYLIQEDEDVERNQAVVDERGQATTVVLVPNRKHPAVLLRPRI